MTITRSGSDPSPIAIVGIGLRLPGGCHDAKSYWDLLVNQKDARRLVPPERFNIDGFHGKVLGAGNLSMRHGYFLDEPVDRFDAAFFSMSQAEVARVDPQQRLLLEVMHEALENAGEVNWRGSDIAVYAGSFGQDWLQMQARDMQEGNVYDITGMDDFVFANRVSYEFDLHGPSMTVKAGCSSSLIALHLACEALNRGDCSGALVGASNLLLSPEYFLALNNLGALSPDGSSRAFDAFANGYARADAVNAVYIKRLDDAVRDGNPVRAIIRSTAVNADGKTVGLTNPSTESQASLIRRAYEKAGICNPYATPMVECHGTGTATGDPLEVAAIVQIFGDQQTYIGSVKPNIGHGEGAAGLSSLIKSVLSLERHTIPPNIKFQTPNPKIPFTEANLVVPTVAVPWPEGRNRRISINSFGLGGANAHVIIEADPSARGPKEVAQINGNTGPVSSQRLLVFSAHTETSLKTMLDKYEAFIGSESSQLTDLAYTLGARRHHRKFRSFCVTDGLSFQPAATVRKPENRRLLFIFTGQGAQWSGMGRELIRDFPSFRKDVQQMDECLSECPFPPPWRMEEDINAAEYAQPLCTAIQIALVNLLRSWNIHADGVVGHSSGEIAAAYTAGALAMKDAILIAFYRGATSSQQTKPGAMAAVGLGRDAVSGLLSFGATIACENSRSSVTISGDLSAVEETLDRVRHHRAEVLARKLKIDRAYHSDHMISVGSVYRELISTITTSHDGSLPIPFFSSVTGEENRDASLLGPDYWKSNMENPVLFLSAVESALESTQDFGMAVELGPHSALSGPFRQICKDRGKTMTYDSCLSRASDGTRSVLSAAGRLFCQGIMVDFAAMNPGATTMSCLPPYPWTHDTSYWHENRISREIRTRAHPEHELLGARVIGGNDLEPSWRKMLSLKEVPWLSDHVVASDVVFPAAGYITMATEAVRQLSSHPASFTIRALSIGSAMPLHNGKTTEIMTRLQPHRLTDNQDSAWFDFSVMSYDGSRWSRHCSGEIRTADALDLSATKLNPSAPEGKREVATAKWYQAAKSVGLEYGPLFQGLQDIFYDLSRDCTSATLQSTKQYYGLLHPTTIDQLLQCCILGSVKGHGRLLNRTALPVYIEEMSIRAGDNLDDLQCDAYTRFSGHDTLSAHGQIGARGGALALQAKGIQFRLLGIHTSTEEDPLKELHLLEWRPDIDLTNLDQMVHQTHDLSSCLEVVERLNILCVLETARILKPMDSSHHHFRKFKEWNEEYIDKLQRNGSRVVKGINQILEMVSEERACAIKALTEEALATPARNIALAIVRIFNDVESIFTGSVEPLAVLLKDNLLMEIYNFFNMLNHRDFFQILGHKNRGTLRVVEIGAGTGGFTSTILPALMDSDGGCLFSTYTYTDISSGFFKAAKERFGKYAGIEYTVLDISKDPASQGLELGSYDLVVAANVLHATPDLVQTMTNCRSLLRPGGRLFMLELCTEAKWVNYIMGTLPGWWLGEADGRPNEPYIHGGQWDVILQKAGFRNMTAIMDQKPPYQLDNIIVATVDDDVATPSKALSLLVRDSNQPSAISNAFLSEFRRAGYDVSLCSLREPPISPVDTVSLLDIDGPRTFFEDLDEKGLRGLIRFITHARGQQILWLTGLAQVSTENPHHAMVLGLARTLRLELDSHFATMELDIGADLAPFGTVVKVFDQIQRQSKRDVADCEYALVNGTVQVPRYVTRTAGQIVTMPDARVFRKLHVGKPGILASLQWQEGLRDSHLREGEVEINVRSSAVTHQDVLLASGAAHGEQGLGFECAGIVSRISTNTSTSTSSTDLQVGDRVLCWSLGSLATHVRVDSMCCIKLPDSLSFNDAVTMPTAYATMTRGLLDINSLATGDTVLINSVSSPMGLAGIQIARMQGAEIFVTARTEAEREFLVTEQGVQTSHVFSSSDNSFVAGIMQATRSRGVDVVVNLLSGDLLHESWKCVAAGGNMIELSGRDITGHGRLDMTMFGGNRGFHGIDIPTLITQKPSLAPRFLKATMDLYTGGSIKPISPIKLYTPSNIKQAFHQLHADGGPIGSVVLEFPDDTQSLPAESYSDEIQFRKDRSYVLIGGLGGLGRSAAVWLAERGAGCIIFMSRSASAGAESRSLVHELKALGCETQIAIGSVTDVTAVDRLVANAAKPVAGVLHLALVLKDEALLDMTFDSWRGATEAKVQGTWNLHRALEGQPLEFFVLASSIYGIQGNPNQANYAAASTFLDAFVQFRQGLGLPASVIDLGVMEDVGYVSQRPAILESLRRAGAQLLCENDFLRSLQLGIRASSAPAPLLPTDLSSAYVNRAQFVVGLGQHPPDARGLGLKRVKDSHQGPGKRATTQLKDSTEEDGDVLRRFLEGAKRDPSSLNDELGVTQFLAAQVAECLKGLLIFGDNSSLDLGLGLADLGVDSLVAIELQSWWIESFGTHISILELTKSASITDLGKLARCRLLEIFHEH
ncbi:ketoacyl-synt-domain-containing protein [Dothidotthia symphoricarpi CBS 119687]|uniref:Ketoacyl-synt-domain-containing protein n=1 Tax=Dothidotthia symphoricarpi CBS 119687 TaxID=1392245 RepID=A0A6A6AFD2_9PLEO|nr:ketoacyl-synt-domain-containing protein [Dothidotthia symphoricarpi CBS 119687]KAF2130682.1 ketoacyl-synt-domain-containing protein [Dothidotthia symphoricarpi CBS 119687]